MQLYLSLKINFNFPSSKLEVEFLKSGEDLFWTLEDGFSEKIDATSGYYK